MKVAIIGIFVLFVGVWVGLSEAQETLKGSANRRAVIVEGDKDDGKTTSEVSEGDVEDDGSEAKESDDLSDASSKNKNASRGDGSKRSSARAKKSRVSRESGNDRKFVPDALRMTLERLAPTKELRDAAVLKALSKVARVDFVPRDSRERAYENERVPLGDGRFLADPFSIAFALEALNIKETDRCLIVGDGTGYIGEVASVLASDVYSLDDSKTLYKRAVESYKKIRSDVDRLVVGDVAQGFSENAPYDKIFLARAVEKIPESLLEQLKDGGAAIAPEGSLYEQHFVLYSKTGDSIARATLRPTLFEPLTEELIASDDRDPVYPELLNGGFEEVDASDRETKSIEKKSAKEENAEDPDEDQNALSDRPKPLGWRDARNVWVAFDADVSKGRGACLCDNLSVALEHEKKDRNEKRSLAATLPEERPIVTEEEKALRREQREEEKRCFLRQTFPIDGTAVKRLIFSGAYKVEELRFSNESSPAATLIELDFFDKDGRPLREKGNVVVLEVGTNATDWNSFSREITPPVKAAEAEVTIGVLDGGVGRARFDELSLKNKREK